MYGRFTLRDLMGRLWWATDSLEELYSEAKHVAQTVNLLICADEVTGKTVYVWNGHVSGYVKDGREDWSKLV